MAKIPVRQIQKVDNDSPNSQRFKIRDVKTLLAGRDMAQELHRHDFFYILALEKGRGKHDIDFISYDINKYSIFILRPGQVHQLTLKKESIGYLIEFVPDFFYSRESVAAGMLRKASNNNFYQLDSKKFTKINSLLHDIFEEYNKKHDEYLEVIKANLEIVFIELVRLYRDSNATSSSNLYNQERLEQLKRLLEEHIGEKKQVSFYADKLNMSGFQLNAITKSTLGQTCSEVINEYIILESKRNLLATSDQVNQIAYRLGYEDTSYFIRFFRKHTGYSPEAFRKNFK